MFGALGKPAVRPCEYEGYGNCEGAVLYRSSMTAYYYKGTPGGEEDPNRQQAMCEGHWQEYYEHYKEKWDDYYSSVL